MKYQVNESISIQAPMETVKELAFDLREWYRWSPWSCLEPDANTSNHKEGVHLEDYLYWDGKIIGEGEITVLKRTSTTLTSKLQFIKPFKSMATVTMKLQEHADGTDVVWNFEGNIPFFLFFMKSTMHTYVSKDYKRGLLRLKYASEMGEVPSMLTFVNPLANQEMIYFVGKRASSFHDQMPQIAKEIFGEVSQTLVGHVDQAIGMAIYHKFITKKDWFEFSMGFGFTHKPDIDLGDLEVIEIPAHKALEVDLEGDYPFLHDAWTGAMMHLRGRKLAHHKKISPYELYLKGPFNEQDPKAYFTKVFLPVK